MADEITINASLKAVKGGAAVNSAVAAGGSQTTHTMSGSDMASFTQLITQAADVALAIPANISPVGDLYVENRDSTNYLELSTGTGGSFAAGKFAKIRPGRRALFQPTGTIYAKANTADCAASATAVEE